VTLRLFESGVGRLATNTNASRKSDSAYGDSMPALRSIAAIWPSADWTDALSSANFEVDLGLFCATTEQLLSVGRLKKTLPEYARQALRISRAKTQISSLR
jgi:hypothetical protein